VSYFVVKFLFIFELISSQVLAQTPIGVVNSTSANSETVLALGYSNTTELMAWAKDIGLAVTMRKGIMPGSFKGVLIYRPKASVLVLLFPLPLTPIASVSSAPTTEAPTMRPTLFSELLANKDTGKKEALVGELGKPLGALFGDLGQVMVVGGNQEKQALAEVVEPPAAAGSRADSQKQALEDEVLETVPQAAPPDAQSKDLS
jgi:hypothetical protein